MTRRLRRHEEHVNHEAWAIPYADLLTLLLAFFVVMYAISSVNEGKFRVLSDSLQTAFRGSPKTIDPVQVGEKSRGSGADVAVTIIERGNIDAQPRQIVDTVPVEEPPGVIKRRNTDRIGPDGSVIVPPALSRVASEVEKALAPLIKSDMVAVHRHSNWIEVEIRCMDNFECLR